MTCIHCGEPVAAAFRFCPWCGTVQRRKLVEFFRGHALIDPRRSLRVSRYLRTPEQRGHVRFSVWSERGEAQAAVSLDEVEAARLALFLRPSPRARRLRELAEQLYSRSSR